MAEGNLSEGKVTTSVLTTLAQKKKQNFRGSMSNCKVLSPPPPPLSEDDSTMNIIL